MNLLRSLSLPLIICWVACSPAELDVPAPEAGMPPPNGAEPAPASSVGDGGNAGGTGDSFGKQEYIGIMADFLCVERAFPEQNDARKAADAAIIEKYGVSQKMLDGTAKDLKKEKEVYDQLQKKITAAADLLCTATGEHKDSAPDDPAPDAADEAAPAEGDAKPEDAGSNDAGGE
jgi:hypothetical protein